MKKLSFLLLFIMFASCQKEDANTKEKLAENIIESLQNNNYEQFKENLPSFELFKLQGAITEEKYDNIISDVFIKCKKEFTEKDIDISEYEIFRVNEPYKKNEWNGFEQINFYVIINNSKDNFLKLDFNDCPKTENGYKLGEAISIIEQMEYSKTKIKEILNDTIDKLFEIDQYLLKENYNINERSVSHRLALHLNEYFKNSDYDVDIEYNRIREEYGNVGDIGNLMSKKLHWENSDEASGENSRFVFPDIIVHKRDKHDNLIEIEIKMAWKNEKKQYDYDKINQYMQELKYKFGVYIELAEKRKDCLIEFGPFELNKKSRMHNNVYN